MGLRVGLCKLRMTGVGYLEHFSSGHIPLRQSRTEATHLHRTPRNLPRQRLPQGRRRLGVVQAQPALVGIASIAALLAGIEPD